MMTREEFNASVQRLANQSLETLDEPSLPFTASRPSRGVVPVDWLLRSATVLVSGFDIEPQVGRAEVLEVFLDLKVSQPAEIVGVACRQLELAP